MPHLESVDNALRLVLLLADGNRITVTEAARELGVAPSTAHRLLGTLVYRQFAQQAGDRSYGMGPSILALRGSRRSRTRLLDIGQPHLRRLTQATEETSHLAILVHHEVRFLISAESQQILRIGSRAGQVMPAHITAAGKTLLADLTPEDFAARYPDGGVPELGLDTAAREALRRELATVRRRGFAVNRGASERGLVAVAVAIRDDEHAFAAVTVSMPSVRYHASRVPELVAALRETAAGVAADLVD